MIADPSRIWRIIEVEKPTDNGMKKKFIIRNIDEERYDEVLDHLCNYYVRDEPLCQSFGMINDPLAIEDLREEWRCILEQGVSVAAFLADENVDKPPLVAVNVLYIGSRENDAVTRQNIIKLKSENVKKMIAMMWRLAEETNIYESYGFKNYIGGIGLSVHPDFRGYGLGQRILETRTEIGRKLSIFVTMTNFTGPESQKAAERAGFKVLHEERYDEMFDDNGKVMFSVEKSKTIKTMGKRFY